MGQILRAHSCAADAVEAVKELQFQFASHASGLIIFFCSVMVRAEAVDPEQRKRQFGNYSDAQIG